MADLITILGPTACGKTSLAVAVADCLDAEIISADSRQVYRGMDIGTGKDLSEYQINGRQIPYHLIDIADAGYHYNLFEYKRDFCRVFNERSKQKQNLILCGGTGLYLEAVLRNYEIQDVPENKSLRAELESKSLDELARILAQYGPLHNVTDIETKKRAIRAIEIADYQSKHTVQNPDYSVTPDRSLVFGIDIDREERRRRITVRLKERLQNGMVDEVRALLAAGVPADDLIYYGLEYKYLTNYVLGRLTYDEMFSQLEIAIHQFAKRQMTWFRGMEKRGTHIHWIDAMLPMEKKVEMIVEKAMKN
ncbi:MAG: tRNA (adenosine(37)-N6)-dimethylallyltransferase MiaA [Paludibacteraceae bacterium]|nr:tRNA (adenosine(37)-N6)-dimethylallyltransferase MiaA [Paludibacteraceae bacterium]